MALQLSPVALFSLAQRVFDCIHLTTRPTKRQILRLTRAEMLLLASPYLSPQDCELIQQLEQIGSDLEKPSALRRNADGVVLCTTSTGEDVAQYYEQLRAAVVAFF